jgi:hypothetical protein
VAKVVIGVDPHKASNTLVVIDSHERVLARQRFSNDRAGYRSMKTFARGHRDRVWAVDGARGVGAGLAQRLVAEGEPVLDVPARLSARVRALGGGSGRKTDDADAFAVAVAGLRARARRAARGRPIRRRRDRCAPGRHPRGQTRPDTRAADLGLGTPPRRAPAGTRLGVLPTQVGDVARTSR